MKRSIDNAVKQYHELKKKYNGGFGAFYISDVEQIRNKAVINGRVDLFEAILVSLQAGYAIGYRTAKRHAGKRKRGDRR